MAGYFTIPRVERDLFGDEHEVALCRRGAWHWLFEQAAWKDCERAIGRFKIRLRRGELAASLRFLARAWGWTHGKVQRFLGLLRKRGLITLRTDAAGLLVISLCNPGISSDSATESVKRRKSAAPEPVPSSLESNLQNPAPKEQGQCSRLRDAPPGAGLDEAAGPGGQVGKEIEPAWLATAAAERERLGLPRVDLRWHWCRFVETARGGLTLGRWLGWARRARPPGVVRADEPAAPELSAEERERRRLAGREEALAKLRAWQEGEAAA